MSDLLKPAAASSIWRSVLASLGSMKVAVVILLYLGILVFAGTIAQIDMSAYDVQKRYFESWTAPLFFGLHGPGGLPVMAMLFLTLVCGGVLRVRWHKGNLGILVAHMGILLLLLAGYVKYQFSISGMVALFETESSQNFVSFHEWELAVIQQDGLAVRERTVSADELDGAHDGNVMVGGGAHGELPFSFLVHHWLDNCEPQPASSTVNIRMPIVDGAYLRPLDTNLRKREVNIAGCYVEVRAATGPVQKAILWGFESRPMLFNDAPWVFEVAGQRYGLMLRRKTWQLPFTLRLDQFKKQDHPGSAMARDFSSYVTVQEAGRDLPVRIFMNNPLRRDGHVVYQTQFGQDPRNKRYYSVFEIGRNPSDAWPEWSCYVIAVGLLLHFGRKLLGYIRAQARQRAGAL